MQSLPEAQYWDSSYADIKIGFSDNIYRNVVIEDGWVFAYDSYGDGYVAVKPSQGSIYRWETGSLSTPYYLHFTDVNVPIVMQAGRVSDYSSFSDFKNQVKATRFTWVNSTTFEYTDIDTGKKITWYTTKTLPKINDETVSLTSNNLFDCQYISSVKNSGIITVTNTNDESFNIDLSKEFSETFEEYLENSNISTSDMLNSAASQFSSTVLTRSGDSGRSLRISPPTSGGTTTSCIWLENKQLFGSDDTNSPFKSGIIVLKADYLISTAFDDTIKSYQLITPWTGSYWSTYIIKGTNIYDSNGTTVLRSSYPVGEWFTMRTTFYSATNKYDVDLIQADGTVISLKSGATYIWPTGGIKKVRYWSGYTSTAPTYRTPFYMNNIKNFRVSLSDCDIISCQVPNNATIC